MARFPFRLLQGNTLDVEPCPSCRNRVSFIGESVPAGEQGFCDVWVTCAICKFDPTLDSTGYRIESVWGVQGPETLVVAMRLAWTDAIRATLPTERSEP